VGKKKLAVAARVKITAGFPVELSYVVVLGDGGL
jgi:hypothetical protein